MIGIHKELLQFLEISEVKYDGKKKFKEVFIIKRAGGRHNEPSSIFRCKARCKCWDKRYLIITSEGVMYSRGREGPAATIREFLLFDYSFNPEYGKQATGAETGIMLKTPSRVLNIKTLNLFDFFDVIAALKLAYEQSKYAGLHRYDSFAPLRTNSICQWFVDSESYFESVCDSFLLAKNEIFITGWWVSPELYLKRPVGLNLNQEFRLDRILKKKAEEGVRIYIIVYNESKFALNISSEYTEKTFKELHPFNIQILRHPNFILPFLWSHHEKIVIIDQEIGYLGGLDLCYGRFDRSNHELVEQELINKDEYMYPNIDYNNIRVKDFNNVHLIQNSDIDRNTQCRLPWHDIHMKVLGKPVKDLSKHFIQYWNFAQVDIDPRSRNEFLLPKDKPGHENPLKPYIENINLRISGLKSQLENYIKQRLLKKQQKSSIEIKSLGDIDQNSQNQKIDDEEDKKINNDYEMDNIIDTSYPQNNEKNNKYHYELYIDTLKLKKQSHSDIKSKTHNQINDEFYKLNKNKQQNPKTNYQTNLEEIKDEDNIQQNQAEQNSNLYENQFQQQQQIKTTQNLDYINDNFIPQQLFFPKSLRSSGLQTPQYRKRRMHQSIDFQLMNKNMDPQFISLLEQLKQIKQEDYKSTGFIEAGSQLSINESDSEIQSSNESGFNFQLQYFQQFFASQPNSETPNRIRHKINEGKQILKLSTKKFNKLKKEGTCTCQILRSASNWSLGLDKENTEISIQIAYLHLIAESKHFIYIENQFFISALAGPTVKNQIATALLQRIKKAAEKQENFQVIVVLPLLPGFEGEIDDSNAGLMKVQLYWEYKTICRGGASLLEELKKDPNIPDPFKYIFFFGLRTHGVISSKPITEIIYVHSKLMIIDDNISIIGSANINDRSMNGIRDSEIAIIVEDEKIVESKMNQVPYQAKKFSHSLRAQLYQEHFGLSYEEVMDPLSQKLNQKIRQQAKINQQIYEQVFACYPTNLVKTIEELHQYQKTADIEKYNQLKNDIRGHAVEWPLSFMENENF